MSNNPDCPQFECEAPPPPDAECEGCGCVVDHGEITWQADGSWIGWICPVCGAGNDVDEETWEVMQERRNREYRRRTARAARSRREAMTFDSIARTNPVDAQAMRDAGRI